MEKVELDLPKLVEADDYHEFKWLEKHLQKLNKELYVEELTPYYETIDYIAIIYYKNKDAKYHQLKASVEMEVNSG